MVEKKNKLKKFKLFDMNRDGKGVEPGEDRTPGLKFFFKQFGRKFSKILSLNMLTMFQILPLAAIVILYFFAIPRTATHVYSEYPVLFGMNFASSSAVTSANLGVFSYQFGIQEHGTGMYWVLAIIAIVYVLTYGWQKVGAIYVTRGLVRGDSVFVFSDFFYGIRKNFKQGFIVGLIDCICMIVLAVDLLYFNNAPVSGFTNFMYVMTFALIIIYLIMRFYIYLMIVTFNIKTFKAIKNAFVFAILGIKRNIMACIGLVIMTAIAVVPILFFFPKFGVVIVLPLIYYLGICSFIYTYAAYPVIKKYMIDPVPPKSDESIEETPAEIAES